MEGKDDKDFIATLRAHGLQVTYQRLAVYQALYYSKEHPSAEAVYQQVRKRFPMISLGTVYKTLERFHDVGLICKVSPITDVSRYDAATVPHIHLVCLKCKSLQDVDEYVPEIKLPQQERNGFKVLSQQVLFQGYCAHCLKDAAAPNS
jgi:Fur family transcriptional regulator, peroxide stress response regulator